MFGPRSGPVIRNHQGAYRDALGTVFTAYEKDYGSWFELLLEDNYANGRTFDHTLFAGAPLVDVPKLGWKMESYYSTHSGAALVRRLARDAENLLREQLALPKVGEGWLSETRLYRAIEAAFPETTVIQHGHPSWLGRQHFDIWVPRWNIAVEYHGLQHFEPVEFFGGEDGFEATVRRDLRKLALCEEHGVRLIVATQDHTHEKVIELLRDHAKQVQDQRWHPDQHR